MKHLKNVLAMVLALVMILSCVGTAFATDKTTVESVAAVEKAEPSAKEGKGFKSNEFQLNNTYRYADNETVRAIVVLEGTPEADVAENNSTKAITHRAKLMAEHKLVRDAMAGIDYELKYEFTRLLDGFSCDVAYGDLESIAAIEGVKSVHIANSYAAPDFSVAKATKQNNANFITGNSSMWESGIDGSGMVVAILDTGLNTKHEAFQDSLGITAAAARLTKEDIEKADTLAEGVYLNAKVPFAYDYADLDEDVTDVQGHGTHVSGTVAGYVGEKSADGGIEYTFAGGAPAAQLLSMKIFKDEGGGTTSDIYFYALEDAYTLGADVVNMSIGAQNGFTFDAELETEVFGNIYQRLSDNGVVMSVAAGNEYSMAQYSNIAGITGYVGPDYMDYGTVASPSTYEGNVSVASVENIAYPSYVIIVGEGDEAPKFAFSDGCTDGEHGWMDNMGGKTMEYVIVPDTTNANPLGNGVSIGNAEDYAGIDVKGKIAVVQRGTTTFEEKVENAANAGAAACIVVNNVSAGNQGMSVETYEVPAVLVTVELLEALVRATKNTITTPKGMVEIANPAAAQMSDFSNWGTSPMLTIDPAITSVGGNVYSSVIGSENAYEVYSGTSMATPNASATFANVLSYIYKTNKDISKADAAKLAKDLLEGTAYILSEGEAFYSVRKQGAGLAQSIWAARSYGSAAYVVDPLKELGDDAEKTGVYKFPIVLKNDTKSDVLYDSIVTLTMYDDLVNAGTYSEPIIVNTRTSALDEAAVTYSVNDKEVKNVTVPAGGSVTVDVTIEISDDLKSFFDAYCVNGAYVEGYTVFTSKDTGTDTHATFLAYYGDWTKDSVLEDTDFRDAAAADIWLNTTVVDAEGNTYGDYGYTYENAGILDFYTSPNIAYLVDGAVSKAYGFAGDNLLNYVDYKEEHISFSTPASDGTYHYAEKLYMEPYQLRNANNLIMTVSNKETGEVYYVDDTPYVPKAYYDSDYQSWLSTSTFTWDGTDKNGNYVPSGTVATVNYDAVLPYGKTEQKSIWSFDVTVDYTAPVLESVVYDKENQTLTVTASDSNYLAAIYLADDYGNIVDSEAFSSDVKGKSFTATFDTSEQEINGVEMLNVVAIDYATNETEKVAFFFETGKAVSVTTSSAAGVMTTKLTVGETYTFGAAPDTENAQFLFWTTEEVDSLENPYYAGGDWYFEGDTIYPKEDITVYAFYAVGEYAKYSKVDYWYNQAEDYAGDWAICGWDLKGTSYDVNNPAALNGNGEKIYVSSLEDAEFDDTYVEFYTNAKEIRFTLAPAGGANNYTIQSASTGKYLACMDGKIAMVDKASAAATWNVTSASSYGSLVYNVADPDMILLYDDEEGAFAIMDDSKPIDWILEEYGLTYYPSDYFILPMYQCDEEYLDVDNYTTKVESDCYFSTLIDCPYTWYHEAIDFVYANGLMNGVSANEFEPNEIMDRSMVVTVLYRMAGSPAVSEASTFVDVPAGEWYSDAIAWAQDNGIVNGVSATEFEPEEPITREQLATILWRYNNEPTAEADLSKFADAALINDWAVGAMKWAVANGLYIGDEGNLKPTTGATRAEFATLIMRYLGGSYPCPELD